MAASPDGIVLLSKQSGITSFSSLWQIKNALGTKKIGHTGTLDTFAEGLLVALVGRYTKLVPFFSDCDKEYLACIEFGSITDTLDPDGAVTDHAELPLYEKVVPSLNMFRGPILQKPPAFSALHVNGQRASDLSRKGELVDLPPRPVTIHSLDIVSVRYAGDAQGLPDRRVASMVVRVVCSKGTYIRSLARDIAIASGSVAHLSALRRTRTGPFALEKAAGFSLLEDFPSISRAVYGKGAKPPEASGEEIRACCLSLDPNLAGKAGLDSVFLDPARKEDFFNGKSPDFRWFASVFTDRDSYAGKKTVIGKAAVFCDTSFMGVVDLSGEKPVYAFVAGRDA